MAIPIACSTSTSTKLSPWLSSSVPDHHEWEAVVAQQLGSIIHQDLGEDDPSTSRLRKIRRSSASLNLRVMMLIE
jgi:hypothetical protein